MITKLISLTRLCLGPASLYLIITSNSDMLLIALMIMLGSLLLNLLNIYLLNQGDSKLSQVIHTVSDSIFHICVFIGFFMNQWITLWIVLIIYSRDIIIPYVQSFAIQNGIHVPDQLISSRLKSIIHGLCQIGIAYVIFMWGLVPDTITEYSSVSILAGIAVAASLISLLHYLAVVAGKQSNPKGETA